MKVKINYYFLVKINFISLDIPEPPNYGGAIDIYYKIKALLKLDCKIILHCFQFVDFIFCYNPHVFILLLILFLVRHTPSFFFS